MINGTIIWNALCFSDEEPEADSHQWCLTDIQYMNRLFENVPCPSCATDSLVIRRGSVASRMGFAYPITMCCTNCEFDNTVMSSPRSETGSYDVNDISTLFFNQMGLSYKAQDKFAGFFGMKGLHRKTYAKKEKKIIDTLVGVTDNILEQSAILVKENYEVPLDDLCNVTVSFDGSWHKRGHTSLYGIAAVIEVNTGLILDYTVLSKYCHMCSLKETEYKGKETAEFQRWLPTHLCCINYVGSSNAMETEAARILWGRSEERGFRYTGFLSDGDSKAYTVVSNLNIYGQEYPIEREECVNHAHKRMGGALRKLRKEKCLGGKGQGKLTDPMCDFFQRMYRKAIKDNVGNPEGMRHAIFATLFHCMSTDERPHHIRCPPGANSWCFYQKAEALGEVPGSHKTNLNHYVRCDIAKYMVAIYERMADPALLQRLSKGKTQNSNESFHSVVWAHCPKRVFVGKRKLDGAVASAVSSYNAGQRGLAMAMAHLNIEVNIVTEAYLEHMDDLKEKQARHASNATHLQKRRVKLAAQKAERSQLSNLEGATYGPGLEGAMDS